MPSSIPRTKSVNRDLLDRVVRELTVERHHLPVKRLKYAVPLTARQQRNNFLDLASALGGLTDADLMFLEGQPLPEIDL